MVGTQAGSAAFLFAGWNFLRVAGGRREAAGRSAVAAVPLPPCAGEKTLPSARGCRAWRRRRRRRRASRAAPLLCAPHPSAAPGRGSPLGGAAGLLRRSTERAEAPAAGERHPHTSHTPARQPRQPVTWLFRLLKHAYNRLYRNPPTKVLGTGFCCNSVSLRPYQHCIFKTEWIKIRLGLRLV